MDANNDWSVFWSSPCTSVNISCKCSHWSGVKCCTLPLTVEGSLPLPECLRNVEKSSFNRFSRLPLSNGSRRNRSIFSISVSVSFARPSYVTTSRGDLPLSRLLHLSTEFRQFLHAERKNFVHSVLFPVDSKARRTTGVDTM